MDAAKRDAWDMKSTLSNIPALKDYMSGTQFTEDNSTTQSYAAGTSKNITFDNTIQISAGAFMGNKRDAKEFAQYMYPYIKEQQERYA